MKNNIQYKALILLFALLFSCDKEEIISPIDDINEEIECNFINYYYHKDEPIILGELSGDYIVIASDTSNCDTEIIKFINSINEFDKDYDYEIKSYKNYMYKRIALKFFTTLTCIEITIFINNIYKYDLIDYATFTIEADNCLSPIWQPMGEKCVHTHSSLFYVRVKDTADLSDLHSIMAETNTEIWIQNYYMPNWFTLIANKESKGDAMQMAKYFYETGLFDSAQPDILKIPVEF